MSFRFTLPSAAFVMAVGGLAPAPVVFAQAAQSDAAQSDASNTSASDSQLEEVVVTGIRGSLQSAQEFKRQSGQIVDSIVAEDIGKLPDINVSDALQRVTGVQIGRDVGEGGTVAIRGLPQVETTLNGREAFTAGGGRSYNFADIPAELLRSVDVYKTPTANLVEGGLGGTIDLRTRKPFDFDGLQMSGSLMGRYSDLAEKTKPQASFLVSDRWETGLGDIGALVSVAYQDRAYRQDLDSTGAPSLRTDLIPGQTITTPNGSYEPLINGDRKRTGVDSVVQWQASDQLVVSAEFNFQHFKTEQDQYGLNIPTVGQTPVAGSFQTFPGTNDFLSGTFSNVAFSTFGVARDVTDDNKMYALNGAWTGDNLKLTGDVSYTKSTNDLYYTELDLTGRAPQFRQDLGASVPSGQLVGVDPTNATALNFGALTRSENHFAGDEKAAEVDGEYTVGSFIKSLMVGVRYGDREAENTPIRFFVNPPATAATAHPELLTPTPFNDFFSKTDGGAPFTRNYLVVPADLLRDDGFNTVRQQLGITTQATVSPLQVFNIEEKTYAGFVRANYEFEAGLPIDGNVGVRFVKTKNGLTGNKANFVNGVQNGFVSVNQDSDYTNTLPSLNLRARFTDDLQLRFAASKVITRPDFSQLSPSLTLVPANGQASSGNPDLQPLKANQLDLSLEYYFARGASAYAATFYKKVKGFVQTAVTPGVVIDGITYNLAQPVNGQDGTIKGGEVGYQQFFDFLPSWLSGLGMQANYTYVESEAPSSVAGLTTTLPQLSKNSYNLVGIYEKGPISGRIAYNWRSKFYESIFVGTGSLGVNPVYRKAYGWLDASVVYDINRNVSLALEGANLLRTKREGFYTVESRPNDRTIDDRQVIAGVRVKW